MDVLEEINDTLEQSLVVTNYQYNKSLELNSLHVNMISSKDREIKALKQKRTGIVIGGVVVVGGLVTALILVK